MAATAYAAAVSLLNTMDQIQIHPLLSTYFNDNYSIQSLREKVDFFADFLEKYSDVESEEAEDLLRRIADVAHEAEEIINVEAADRVRDGFTTESSITEEMDCIKETGFINPYSPLPLASSSAPPPTVTAMSNRSYAKDLMRRVAAVARKAMPRRLQRENKMMDSNTSSSVPLSSSPTPATMVGFDGYVSKAMETTSSSMPSSSSPPPPPAVLLGLQRITEEMNLLKEEISKFQEGTGFITRQRTYSSMPSSSSSSAPPATTMVGFEGYLEKLLDQLTGHHSGLEILPIVGMGGIGKTTLATDVYNNSNIMQQFKYRVWITVSQKFSPRKIYLQALSCLGISAGDTNTLNDQQLSEKLYQFLYDRRYLVVLDDVWSIDAWDEIRNFFPENKNKSRIVVTTRELELIHYFGSSAHFVDFLDEKSSWELLCEKTFAQQGCPHLELEEVGKKIAKKCKGLPLAITVIGGLLRESPITREYWEKIAEDRSLILDSGDGTINPLSILYLSYKHLPICLKSCFLYLGLFPEDYEIDAYQLVKLWVAEGFIRSKTEHSLEEVAEFFIKQLFYRNLILIRVMTIDNKLTRFRVHDLVRELCIRTGEKEKYFCVQRDIDGKHHYIVDESTARLFYPQESQEMNPSIVHPLVLEGKRAKLQPLKSRLLKVSLYRYRTNRGSYSQDVNLRYFSSGFKDDNAVRSSMQLFWSLQTLIIDHWGKTFEAPLEIWKMPQLRHIDMIKISLPDPPISTCEDNVIVLHNLRTLKKVINFKLSEEVCKRIPNIKELELSIEFNEAKEASTCNYHLQNLGRFDKLESLRLNNNYPGGDLLRKLPSSIQELTLSDCKLPWSDMAMIASLPHLQSLNLWSQAFVGAEWNLGLEEFPCLKYVTIFMCSDLIHWNIAAGDSSNFPVLEKLSLALLDELEGIPSVIGEIPTLEEMHLRYCSESANLSAIEILKEQEHQGNLSLQLNIYFGKEEKAEMWREKMQELDITCQNLHFHTERMTKN